MVRCCMGGAGSGLSPWGAENGERLARATLNLNESGAVRRHEPRGRKDHRAGAGPVGRRGHAPCRRSEEHTSELQSLMRISYAVFCLKKKTKNTKEKTHRN